MAVSADGKKIASGDAYRYTYVFDAESHEEMGKFAFHPASLLNLAFSDDGDHLVTVATDMSFGYINLASGKHKQVKNPHGDKKCQKAMIMPDGKVATAGDDCCIRIWNLSDE